MPDLGRKHTCHSCQTKYYDLGKNAAVCPKCGAEARDSNGDSSPSSGRSRRAPKERMAAVAVAEELDEGDDYTEPETTAVDQEEEFDEVQEDGESESSTDDPEFEADDEEY